MSSTTTKELCFVADPTKKKM